MYKKAAGVLIINEKGQILVFGRTKDGFKYGVPGGKLEGSESTSFAAQRECFEETGIHAYKLDPVPFIGYDGEYEFSTYKVNYYEGSITNERPYEGIAKWGDVNDLLNGSFPEYNKAMLEHFGVI